MKFYFFIFFLLFQSALARESKEEALSIDSTKAEHSVRGSRELKEDKPPLLFDLSLDFQTESKEETLAVDSTKAEHSVLARYFTTAPEDKPPLLSDLSLDFQSVFTFKNNNFLPDTYSWSLEIPYIELTFSYPFVEDSLATMELDISYKNQNWEYDIDKFFIQKDFLLYLPFQARAGYFAYPVSYLGKSLALLYKKTATEKHLFPSGDRDMGLSLSAQLGKFVYGQVSWQMLTDKRETDAIPSYGVFPIWTASLLYKNSDQKAFLSYFRKSFFLEGVQDSLGLGLNLSYKTDLLKWALKGEFWGIQRTKPRQAILTYYLLPSVRWKFVSFSLLFGEAYHYLKRSGQSWTLEYILKTDFHLTDQLLFSVERLREQDSVLREDSWAFSLKTAFKIQ